MVTKKSPNNLCTCRQSGCVAYLLMVLWSDLVLARTKASRLASTLDICSLHACSLHACSLHDWDLCAQREMRRDFWNFSYRQPESSNNNVKKYDLIMDMSKKSKLMILKIISYCQQWQKAGFRQINQQVRHICLQQLQHRQISHSTTGYHQIKQNSAT